MSGEMIDSFKFLIYAEGELDPIGFSILVRVYPEVVLLGGSAVSESWRERGIDKATIAKRLEMARTLGATTAVIQAVEETSAPIVRRLGFRELSESAFYVGNVG